ncbi:MAG: AprI/Inh family metalloprotease inhibitor [Beijerinckiaceae bacterium]
MCKFNRQHILSAVVVGLVAAGCDGSGRFSDFNGGVGRQAVASPSAGRQTFTPAPTGRVDASPLPPVSSQPLPPLVSGNAALGGLPQPGSGNAPALGGLPPAGSSVSIDPEFAPAPAARPDSAARPDAVAPPSRPQQVAARPEPAPQQAVAPSRTSVTGNWTAKEAAGGTCRMLLSSAPTLDLYKASSTGCQSRELQRVSAWELRGEEIYLYEPGGGIAARLKQSGRNFEGSSAKTGAPVTLTK